MSLINVEKLGHKYKIKDKDGNVTGEKWAVKNMDFSARKGEIISILGKNGSGKSTFARHLNGLLAPDEGSVIIENNSRQGCFLRTDNENELVDIRKEIGMIFQNPDNQMVGNTVAEDIGFGLENLGWRPRNIWERIYQILELTNMEDLRDRNVSHLSGGQKQRLAIASVMAMRPSCIVMDEATSMLDPENSKKVLDTLYQLNSDFGISIIMITHRVEETVNSDYIYVMENGNVALSGKPSDIYRKVDELEKLGVESLFQYKIAKDLNLDLSGYGDKILSLEDVAREVNAKYSSDEKLREEINRFSNRNNDVLISAKNLFYNYKDGNNEIEAVKDISFSIRRGEKLAIAGKTGSGKSTLLYMLNGLYRPQKGELSVCGFDVKNAKNLKTLRKKIGFVFQYPEHQLFGNTVLDDVMYGPMNFGMKKGEALEAAKRTLSLVGISEDYYEYSPFDLSGGQKKRVALAGILAYEPEILILDEPVCGLDPQAKKEFFNLINALNEEKNVTVIFVSHDMKDVYEVAHRLIVLDGGALVYDGDTGAVLENEEMAEKFGLDVPDAARFKNMWRDI